MGQFLRYCFYYFLCNFFSLQLVKQVARFFVDLFVCGIF